MKFREIPQYTSAGSYQVNMPLIYAVEWIEREIKEENLQLNPDFQRGHVWTEEQQIKYIEYLLKGGKSARIIYFNHPGWLGSFKGDFVCVDGLQRITAVMKFIKNEVPAFGTYYKDFEDKIPIDVDLLFNVNNLKTRKEVLQWYIEFNSGGTIHTDDEINKVKKLLEEELNK
jgi:uncharacterized protein with ParB-like and HNH nuclease domain